MQPLHMRVLNISNINLASAASEAIDQGRLFFFDAQNSKMMRHWCTASEAAEARFIWLISSALIKGHLVTSDSTSEAI